MKKFSSRKFIVTMTGMLCATVLAAFSNMTSDVAIVIGAGMGAYNWANAKVAELQ
jgi:hypothetical protein